MNSSQPTTSRYRHAAVGAILLCIVFGYGVGVGAYKWPPYGVLQKIKQRVFGRVDNDVPIADPESQLLELGFSDPLISGEQILPSISTIDEINRAVTAMAMPVNGYWDAYETMSVGNPTPLELDSGKTTLVEVPYQIGDLHFSAHAYINAADGWGGNSSAVLVIPGSGENQSSQIYRRVEDNYQQNVLDVFEEGFDRFVMIKPNQDCLAIHNGEKKLSRDFYANWLLDHGSSYGAHYVTSAIAIVKAMQEKYDHVVIAGMSQGGEATMLAALQSEPDAAIVASGYSAVYEQVKWSGSNQIVIPGIGPKLTMDALREKISQQSTRYLFTWGKRELATYGIEANQSRMCKSLADLSNVRCISHEGSHEFPLTVIRDFLRSD